MPSSKPWPISPSTLRPGTRTSSKTSEAGPPSPMVWMKCEVQPIERSTRNAVAGERDERAAELGPDQRLGDRRQVHAAVLLGRREPPEAELAGLELQFAPLVTGHARLALALAAQHLRLARHDLVRDELACRV